ncbi:MAG: N-acetylmuramic acid 6-phosphate etherase [Vicinamibacteria bacterium]|nr:N-acetylmuramic acid 6-phosphate etherase [Vicinamibacteria bacterium]
MTAASKKRTAGPARPTADRWSRLLTESRNPRSRDLDQLPTAKVVALLLDEDRRALVAAARAQRAIARAADLAATALAAGGRIVFLGAGTSGRLAILEAAECPPTFGTAPEQILGVMAGGEQAVFRAVEGAEDRGEDGVAAAATLGPRDLLVGISASSVTPFVHGALASARARGARTVLVTCAPGRGLTKLADVAVVMATGPEVLTGSTRLKAGSATKAALNAITTAAMVRLGKAYENLMVDLRQNSAKLVSRARRIVSIAGGVPIDEAARLLEAAGGEAKTAIVMARLGLDAAAARVRLDAADGHVRRALAARRKR